MRNAPEHNERNINELTHTMVNNMNYEELYQTALNYIFLQNSDAYTFETNWKENIPS